MDLSLTTINVIGTKDATFSGITQNDGYYAVKGHLKFKVADFGTH